MQPQNDNAGRLCIFLQVELLCPGGARTRLLQIVLRIQAKEPPGDVSCGLKAVDMNINIIVSQVEPDLLLGNIVRSETNTTTHMIVGDGGTILLSGILFQQDVFIERKIPLLGDIPLLGGL